MASRTSMYGITEMSWYSRRGYGWGGFAPQMSVAELEARAEQVAARIAKKEKRELKGVKLAGRTIAKTFWGKAWCDNIETYRDYAYRLERGRKYVRSGSVIDLVITKGHVQALVVGSERIPYSVSIDIKTMAKAKWDGLEWWCLDWNQPSIDFYLSLGAEPMKDWTVYRIAGETLKALAIKGDKRK